MIFCTRAASEEIAGIADTARHRRDRQDGAPRKADMQALLVQVHILAQAELMRTYKH
jgi:hypothetical protein